MSYWEQFRSPEEIYFDKVSEAHDNDACGAYDQCWRCQEEKEKEQENGE